MNFTCPGKFGRGGEGEEEGEGADNGQRYSPRASARIPAARPPPHSCAHPHWAGVAVGAIRARCRAAGAPPCTPPPPPPRGRHGVTSPSPPPTARPRAGCACAGVRPSVRPFPRGAWLPSAGQPAVRTGAGAARLGPHRSSAHSLPLPHTPTGAQAEGARQRASPNTWGHTDPVIRTA